MTAPSEPTELKIPGVVIRPTRPGRLTYWLNASICRFGSRTLLAYRAARMPSLLAISELDGQGQPGEPKFLFPLNVNGVWAEDPRLFQWSGELHLFCAEIGPLPNCVQCWARLNDRLEVVSQERMDFDDGSAERRFLRAYFGIAQQKNWAPFVQENRLFSVYSSEPFTVIEHHHRSLKRVHRGERITWPLGEIRGGAPPVWRDGLWYHFFHSAHPAVTFERPEEQGLLLRLLHVRRQVLPALDDPRADPRRRRRHFQRALGAERAGLGRVPLRGRDRGKRRLAALLRLPRHRGPVLEIPPCRPARPPRALPPGPRIDGLARLV